jgi:hypothetical protein
MNEKELAIKCLELSADVTRYEKAAMRELERAEKAEADKSELLEVLKECDQAMSCPMGIVADAKIQRALCTTKTIIARMEETK